MATLCYLPPVRWPASQLIDSLIKVEQSMLKSVDSWLHRLSTRTQHCRNGILKAVESEVRMITVRLSCQVSNRSRRDLPLFTSAPHPTTA